MRSYDVPLVFQHFNISAHVETFKLPVNHTLARVSWIVYSDIDTISTNPILCYARGSGVKENDRMPLG